MYGEGGGDVKDGPRNALRGHPGASVGQGGSLGNQGLGRFLSALRSHSVESKSMGFS